MAEIIRLTKAPEIRALSFGNDRTRRRPDTGHQEVRFSRVPQKRLSVSGGEIGRKNNQTTSPFGHGVEDPDCDLDGSGLLGGPALALNHARNCEARLFRVIEDNDDRHWKESQGAV